MVCSKRLKLASYVVDDDFEFLILLLAPPKCLDYRCTSTCLFYAVLGLGPRRHIYLASTLSTEPQLQPWWRMGLGGGGSIVNPVSFRSIPNHCEVLALHLSLSLSFSGCVCLPVCPSICPSLDLIPSPTPQQKKNPSLASSLSLSQV